MNACLLLLDMQHGILRSGRIPWESPQIPEVAIKSAGELLDAARRLKMLVLRNVLSSPLKAYLQGRR